MFGSPVARLMLLLGGLDLLFNLLLAYSYLAMMGIEEAPARNLTLAASVTLSVLRIAIWCTYVASRLKLVTRWRERRKNAAPSLVHGALRAAYDAPLAVSVCWSSLFAAAWVVLTGVLYVGFPQTVPLGPHTITATAMVTFAVLMGATELAFPLVEWMLAGAVEELSVKAQALRQAASEEARTEDGEMRGLSFRTRIIAFALALAAAPSLYLAAIVYMNDARTSALDLGRQAQLAAVEVAEARALGGPLETDASHGLAFVADASGKIVAGEAARQALEARPALRRALGEQVREPQGLATHPREGVLGLRRAGTETIGVLIPEVAPVSTGSIALLVLFLIIILIWAPLSALFIAGSTATPVARISEALAQVRDGDISGVARMPVWQEDEVGLLAENLNSMVDQLRDLVARAAEVSKGSLDIDIRVEGQIGDAFRAQINSLREMVGHIAKSSLQLAGAAAELYAAAQEQEATAQQQSSGVDEVARTMESLLDAATHVSDASTGVLGKAERTRETTAKTSERMGELTTHAGRIGEILDVIREIADKSDLLALNASLEGTRAGEAGRTFALVAAEMRKLAERVTAAVQHIQTLVANVHASVSATVLVTEESSKLAEGTSESARQINLVTQQQCSGTEQARQSMQDVALMITQSLAATQQIRTLAGDVKTQADDLTRIVSRFRLEGGAAAPHA